jgi:hypothetical protein
MSALAHFMGKDYRGLCIFGGRCLRRGDYLRLLKFRLDLGSSLEI